MIVFVLMVVVPETESAVTPVMVSVVPSPKTALPVMVSAIAPPFKVEALVTVVPVNVLVPVPDTVTAPL